MGCCFNGFGLFSLLEYGIVKIIDKGTSSSGCTYDRNNAIKNGERYYFDTKLCYYIDLKTGHKCECCYEYSKYGNGYYIDLVTGEKLDYFGSEHPNYESPEEREERIWGKYKKNYNK